jgi:hypothetical protein
LGGDITSREQTRTRTVKRSPGITLISVIASKVARLDLSLVQSGWHALSSA